MNFVDPHWGELLAAIIQLVALLGVLTLVGLVAVSLALLAWGALQRVGRVFLRYPQKGRRTVQAQDEPNENSAGLGKNGVWVVVLALLAIPFAIHVLPLLLLAVGYLALAMASVTMFALLVSAIFRAAHGAVRATEAATEPAAQVPEARSLTAAHEDHREEERLAAQRLHREKCARQERLEEERELLEDKLRRFLPENEAKQIEARLDEIARELRE